MRKRIQEGKNILKHCDNIPGVTLFLEIKIRRCASGQTDMTTLSTGPNPSFTAPNGQDFLKLSP
jgi:hypothetical protein